MVWFLFTASTAQALVRSALGLLPELGPYTEEDAVMRLKQAAVVAGLLLCDYLKLEEEGTIVEEAAKKMRFWREYERHKNKTWLDYCREHIKRFVADFLSEKVRKLFEMCIRLYYNFVCDIGRIQTLLVSL